MWVYEITLNEKVTAGELESDWSSMFAASIGSRGTSVGGLYAVVTSQTNVGNHTDFETMPYVDSVTESLELPDPASPDWDPPYAFSGAGGGVEFTE